ncbi:MAG: flavodoxin [Treponematales bacterium]
MKTAVIYFSLNGNSALTARTLASVLDADVFELRPRPAAPPAERTIRRLLWFAGQMTQGRGPRLEPLDFDPAPYGLIIIGGPVWAGRPAPALDGFLRGTRIQGKRLGLFCTHAGGKGKALETLAEMLPGNEIAGTIDLLNPAQADIDALVARLSEWARSLS